MPDNQIVQPAVVFDLCAEFLEIADRLMGKVVYLGDALDGGKPKKPETDLAVDQCRIRELTKLLAPEAERRELDSMAIADPAELLPDRSPSSKDEDHRLETWKRPIATVKHLQIKAQSEEPRFAGERIIQARDVALSCERCAENVQGAIRLTDSANQWPSLRTTTEKLLAQLKPALASWTESVAPALVWIEMANAGKSRPVSMGGNDYPTAHQAIGAFVERLIIDLGCWPWRSRNRRVCKVQIWPAMLKSLDDNDLMQEWNSSGMRTAIQTECARSLRFAYHDDPNRKTEPAGKEPLKQSPDAECGENRSGVVLSFDENGQARVVTIDGKQHRITKSREIRFIRAVAEAGGEWVSGRTIFPSTKSNPASKIFWDLPEYLTPFFASSGSGGPGYRLVHRMNITIETPQNRPQNRP